MDVIQLSYPLTKEYNQPIVLAIGYFDGVHRGHQQVIKRACEIAKKQNLPCGVMTFSPHPKEVLGITQKIDQLTPIDVKFSLLKDLGVDIVYHVKFTKEFANISAEEFVEKVLIPLSVRGIVIGFDFTFGYKGLSNAYSLIELSHGIFSVDVISPHTYEGEKISSTRIRRHLLSGEIPKLKTLLGRNFSLKGKVVHGQKRGRTIGFPTANLQLINDYLTLKNGVYVVLAHIDKQIYTGVMNIGYKPTVTDINEPTYEVHLIDYEGDLYDKILEVELIDYLREEQKFYNLEELKEQINKDILKAKDIISSSTY